MASSSRATGSSRRTSRWSGLLAFIILAAAGGLTYGSARLGIQVIFDPNAVVWVNRFLPDWTRIPTANQQLVQTLGDVQAMVRQSGLVPGEMIPLRRADDGNTTNQRLMPTDMLLPVLAPATGCADRSDCYKIVELRVYQLVDASGKLMEQSALSKRQQRFYWLASRVEVTGPEESLTSTPLSDAQTSGSNSNQSLPLTDVEIFQGNTPKTGVWLNLKGQHTRNGRVLYYGQVLHYNPETNYLGSMLSWSGTPSLPVWEQFTGGGAPELVINQTIDLEPQYRVYRVKPRKFLLDPIQLEPISLLEPAVPTRSYHSVLILARSGLWTPAQQWLDAIKAELPKNVWTPDAQAQLDYIRLHATATRAQTSQKWGSASQQIFVYLIDGQWSQAIATMQKNLHHREEILTMLKTDSGRLWNRVSAAMKVNPNRAEVQFWGGLILMAQQGKGRAMAWVRKQPGSDADYVKAIKLMNQLDPPKPADKPSNGAAQASNATTSTSAPAKPISPPSPTQTAPPPSYHPTRIIGTAAPASGVNLGSWFVHRGGSLPPLDRGQLWYEVTVTQFHDGRGWRRSPVYDLPTRLDILWNLMALDQDPYLTLTVWNANGEQQAVSATVQGLQVGGGTVRLLASGQAVARSGGSSLALSNQAITMLQPSTTTLADLSQQNPTQATKLLQALWSDLQQVGLLLPSATPTLDDVLSRTDLGSWQLQQLDLTGNSQAELILKLNAAALARAGNKERTSTPTVTGSRTLIFADNGSLLYSELTLDAGQMLVAIADLADGRPPVAVVYRAGNYSLQRWSAASKRFE